MAVGLVRELEQAMEDRGNGKVVPPQIAHRTLSGMYQWTDVASRTERVYDRIMDEPVDDLSSRLMK